MKVSSPKALEFACHSKACAPPPAGHGGSSAGAAHTARLRESYKAELERGGYSVKPHGAGMKASKSKNGRKHTIYMDGTANRVKSVSHDRNSGKMFSHKHASVAAAREQGRRFILGNHIVKRENPYGQKGIFPK